MNTGAKGKRKAAANRLHRHEEYASSNISVSQDVRRLRVRTETFGSSRDLPSTAPEASEDLQTLQSLNDLDNFSYLLGDSNLPYHGEDDGADAEVGDSDGIRVTLKSKRNDKSVCLICLYRCDDSLTTNYLGLPAQRVDAVSRRVLG